MKEKRHIKVIYKMIPIGVIIGVIIVTLFYIVNFKLFSSVFDNVRSETELGNAIAGTTAPLLGILTIIATFLAFWIQYTFNRRQLNFFIQDKLDRKTEESTKMIIDIVNMYACKDTHVLVITIDTVKALIQKSKESDYINNSFIYLIEDEFIKCYKLFYNIYHHRTQLYKDDVTLADLVNPTYDDSEIAKIIYNMFVYNISLFEILNLFLNDIEPFTKNDEQRMELVKNLIKKSNIYFPSNPIVFSYLVYFVNLKNDEKESLLTKIIHNYYENKIIDSQEIIDFIDSFKSKKAS